jgi:WD40 repeat protein
MAFSPDGKWLATGDLHDTTVWEAANGREVARIAHESWVQTIAFSPDSQWLATGSGDYAVRVWEVATGRELAHMVHGGPIHAVAFSPDGQRIASASWDSTARVWLWRPETLIAEACARLTRNLTQEEWRQYMGEKPYHKTCANLP